jgi:hypothetical protein
MKQATVLISTYYTTNNTCVSISWWIYLASVEYLSQWIVNFRYCFKYCKWHISHQNGFLASWILHWESSLAFTLYYKVMLLTESQFQHLFLLGDSNSLLLVIILSSLLGRIVGVLLFFFGDDLTGDRKHVRQTARYISDPPITSTCKFPRYETEILLKQVDNIGVCTYDS